MGRNLRRISGILTATDGVKIPVPLDVTTVELLGGGGVADEAISNVALAASGIADGEYMLEYFCLGSHRAPVSIQYGILISR